MKQSFLTILALFLLSCFHSKMNAQDTPQICDFMPGTQDVYQSTVDPTNLRITGGINTTANLDSGSVVQYFNSDGTGRIQAFFTDENDSNAGWKLDLYIHQRKNWDEWSTQPFPTSYLDDAGVVTDEYLDWNYYIIQCGILEGMGIYEGTYMDVEHSPSNNFYALQIGENTNSFNDLLGIVSWSNATGTYVNPETESEEEGTLNLTFRATLENCQDTSQEIDVDISNIGDITIPICFFNGISILNVEQTPDNAISIVQTQGCPLEFDFTLGQDITLTTAAVGYNEFVITYDGPCGDFQQNTFAISFSPCSPSDNCLPFSAGEDIFLSTCDSGPVQLDADIFCQSTGAWAIIEGNGTIENITNPNSLFTASPGNNALLWSSFCNDELLSDTVNVFLSEEELVYAGEDEELHLCTPEVYQLNADPISLPAIGIWTQISGPEAQLSDVNDPNATVTIDSPGTYVWEWSTDSQCSETNSDEVILTITGLQFTAGEDIEIFDCGTNEVILQGALNPNSFGEWEVFSGSNQILEIDNPNSLFTPNLGENILVWNSECNSTAQTDSVIITLSQVINPEISSGDNQTMLYCEELEIELSGSDTAGANWVQISGPDIALLDPSSATTSFNAAIPGEYLFSWQYQDQCGTEHSSLQQINIEDFSLNAGDDIITYLCNDYSQACLNPTSFSSALSNYQWQVTQGEAIILEPNNLFACLDFNEESNSMISLTIEDGCGEIISDQVSITVLAQEEPSDLCLNSPDIIENELPESFEISSQEVAEAYTGNWNQISGPTTLEFEDPNSYTTFFSNLDYGVYQIEWVITDPSCGYEFSCPQNIEFVQSSVEGCTLPFAINFNSIATLDDGSCEFDFTICDCDLTPHSPYEMFQLGNGVENNSAPLNFNCETWGYDCGDIDGAPDTDPFDVCNLNLPPNNGCDCQINSLNLDLGSSFIVEDSVYTQGQWAEIELCYSSVLVQSNITGECPLTQFCFGIQDNWNCVDLTLSEITYYSNDIIPFETPLSNILFESYVSTALDQSEVMSIFIPECTTGINQPFAEFSIFPNPTSDLINISSPIDEYDFNLIDFSGKLIFSERVITGKDYEVSISNLNLASGIYIIQIQHRLGTFRERIVISRP